MQIKLQTTNICSPRCLADKTRHCQSKREGEGKREGKGLSHGSGVMMERGMTQVLCITALRTSTPSNHT